MGQHDQVHQEIVQHWVKETDFGKDLDKAVEDLRITYRGELTRVSVDVWNVLMDKSENEAYDKIEMFHK